MKLCVTLIGLGGTGSALRNTIVPYLTYKFGEEEEVEFVFVDRDIVEDSNLSRQIYPSKAIGKNKAAYSAYVMRHLSTNIKIFDSYWDKGKLLDFLLAKEDYFNIVLDCVDNSASRLAHINALLDLPSSYNFLYVTPGNAEYTGQCFSWAMIDGKELGTNPALVQENIRNPKDFIPRANSCQQEAVYVPQTILANTLAATAALSVIVNFFDHSKFYSEIYFDGKQCQLKGRLAGLDIENKHEDEGELY